MMRSLRATWAGFPEALSGWLDAKALELREQVAEDAMVRYAEGFHDGYLQAAKEAGIYIVGGSPVCGYLGACKLASDHEGHHIV